MKKWSTFGQLLKRAFVRRNNTLLVNLASFFVTTRSACVYERSIKKHDKLSITSVGVLLKSWPICFLEVLKWIIMRCNF